MKRGLILVLLVILFIIGFAVKIYLFNCPNMYGWISPLYSSYAWDVYHQTLNQLTISLVTLKPITRTIQVHTDSWKITRWSLQKNLEKIWRDYLDNMEYYNKFLLSIPQNVSIKTEIKQSADDSITSCENEDIRMCPIDVSTNCLKGNNPDEYTCSITFSGNNGTLVFSSISTFPGADIITSNFLEGANSMVNQLVLQAYYKEHPNFSHCLLMYLSNGFKLGPQKDLVNYFRKLGYYQIALIYTENWLPFTVIQPMFHLYFPDGSKSPSGFISTANKLLQHGGTEKLQNNFGNIIYSSNLTNLEQGNTRDKLAKAYIIYNSLACGDDQIENRYIYSVTDQLIWMNKTNSTNSVDHIIFYCQQIPKVNISSIVNKIRELSKLNLKVVYSKQYISDSGLVYPPSTVSVSRTCEQESECNYTIVFKW
uniref:Uncharacterized protein n=1 Tax=uncultured euryarchaeote Alv-FOS5 TaxID=337891 RepID=Q3SB88_9EURY|nr:hypothetical protein [uncultured euryarchaeote Alv-FOS5]